jgi:hypothetical protein
VAKLDKAAPDVTRLVKRADAPQDDPKAEA